MTETSAPDGAGRAGEVSSPDVAVLLDWFETMHRIREFERTCLDLRSERTIIGTVHPYAGHEAIAVGALAAREPHDWVASYYRCHGHAIASGVPLDAMLAEMTMREGALCRGHGGSMHLADPRVRFMGGNAIVGANVPIAAGLALASTVRGEQAVCLSFLGDGATAAGPFHETLGVAAAQRLPVVFVCENNGWQDLTPSRQVFADTSLARLADGHGVAACSVDGNDVLAVHGAVREAVGRARGGDGPSFVECRTLLQWFHAQSFDDPPEPYFPEHEREEARRRDPLVLLADRLRALGVTGSELDLVAARAAAEVARVAGEVTGRPALSLEGAALHEWVE